jgi:hypothetical protein
MEFPMEIGCRVMRNMIKGKNIIGSRRGAASFQTAMLVLSVLFAGVLLSFVVGPFLAWPLVLGAMLSILLIGNPRAILISYLLWSAIVARVEVYTRHPSIQYMDELLYFLATGYLVFAYIVRKKWMPDVRQITVVMLWSIAIFAVSAGLNGSSPMGSIHTWKNYFSGYSIFFLSLAVVRVGDAFRFVRFLFGLSLVWFVLNMGWKFGVNPILHRHMYHAADFAVGTLSACNEVAYVLGFIMFILLALLPRLAATERVVVVLMVALTAGHLYFTYSNHVYFILAFALVVQMLVSYRGVAQRFIAVSAIALAVGVVILADAFLLRQDWHETSELGWANTKEIERRMRVITQGPKGQMTRHVWHSARREVPWINVIGAGPGNFLSGNAIASRPPAQLAYRYLGEFYFTYTGQQDFFGYSIIQHPNTGFLAILSELGVVGLFLYVAPFFVILIRVGRNLRMAAYGDRYRLCLAQSFPAAVVLIAGVNVLTDLLWHDFLTITLWMWAALVWRPDPAPEGVTNGLLAAPDSKR